MVAARIFAIAAIAAAAACLEAHVAHAADDSGNKIEPASIIGCWEHKRYGESAGSGEKPFAGSHLVCFNDKSVMSGVTFDAGDGWDWVQPYILRDNHVMSNCYQLIGKEYGWAQCEVFTVRQIDSSGMNVESDGKLLRYRLVCHTEQENIQCERLRDELPRND
jgi:hypothetical protein